MPDATPPFAPARARFAFSGLVAQAARAPLGGPRETLTAALMAARLASGQLGPHPLLAAARRARADGAKSWLGALTLPAKLRSALLRCFESSAGDDPLGTAEAVAQVTDITAPQLDRNARSDLVRLGESLRRDATALAGPSDRAVE